VKKNKLAGAPAPAPKGVTASAVPVETKPVSGLTRAALSLAHERHRTECEAIGQEASKLEGYTEADGWHLDVDVMLWFRPKKTAAPALVEEPK
jgi:hypothetical protein